MFVGVPEPVFYFLTDTGLSKRTCYMQWDTWFTIPGPCFGFILWNMPANIHRRKVRTQRSCCGLLWGRTDPWCSTTWRCRPLLCPLLWYVRGLSQLLHDRMRPKCRASEEIRNLFMNVGMKKMLVRKHARSEAPVGDRCAMICNRSCDMSYVLVRSLCNKSECCTMKRHHRTSNQVIGRWSVR